MPIRINLLAEAQAAEELRRRDPIKRIIYGGMLLVALMLAWWSWLQVRVMVANTGLSQIQAQIAAHTNAFEVVQANQKKIAATKGKLAALQKLAQDRFLQGNLLNALQGATVPGVQLVKLGVDQSYVVNGGTTGNGSHGESRSIAEKITVTLDARDFSSNPGDQVSKFKEAISQQPYFQAALNKTNGVRLMNLSPPQVGPDGKLAVMFTVQCLYLDHNR